MARYYVLREGWANPGRLPAEKVGSRGGGSKGLGSSRPRTRPRSLFSSTRGASKRAGTVHWAVLFFYDLRKKPPGVVVILRRFTDLPRPV